MKIKVFRKVAQDLGPLAHAGARVGAAVGRGIKPRPAHEDVLDELEVGVVAKGLVVDEAAARVVTDHQARNT